MDWVTGQPPKVSLSLVQWGSVHACRGCVQHLAGACAPPRFLIPSPSHPPCPPASLTLQTIGYVYSRSAGKELAKDIKTLGVGWAWEALRSTGHGIKTQVS